MMMKQHFAESILSSKSSSSRISQLSIRTSAEMVCYVYNGSNNTFSSAVDAINKLVHRQRRSNIAQTLRPTNRLRAELRAEIRNDIREQIWIYSRIASDRQRAYLPCRSDSWQNGVRNQNNKFGFRAHGSRRNVTKFQTMRWIEVISRLWLCRFYSRTHPPCYALSFNKTIRFSVYSCRHIRA